MSKAVPERLRWAVETLDIGPADRVLEIGCGRGVAVSLVCPRLVDGKITAIDRSETAVAAARQANLDHIAAGLAEIRVMALETAEFGSARFDKVFAVNVNHFWVRSAVRELDLIKRLLAPQGVLYLFYEPPSAAKADELVDRLRDVLVEQGFSVEVTRAAAQLMCLAALTSASRPQWT